MANDKGRATFRMEDRKVKVRNLINDISEQEKRTSQAKHNV